MIQFQLLWFDLDLLGLTYDLALSLLHKLEPVLVFRLVGG